MYTTGAISCQISRLSHERKLLGDKMMTLNSCTGRDNERGHRIEHKIALMKEEQAKIEIVNHILISNE